MKYRIYKAKIVERVISSYEIKGKSGHIKIFLDSPQLIDIDRNDILGIIKQFEDKGKLKIMQTYFGNQLNIKGPWDLVKEPRHYIEIGKIDIKYFEEELLKDKHLLDDRDAVTGMQTFYIYFAPDRRILLNGKIEIAKPDFDSENERIFTYLYNHPNKKISIKELKEETDMTKPIDKVLSNLGFVRGLRSAFFDVNKTSIKFKKEIQL